MNRTLNFINDNYKVREITKKNNVYIVSTDEGIIAVKESKIDYSSLYNYLYSRNFNYIPKLISYRDGISVTDYQEDVSLSLEQKGIDLIHLVSLLHNKTSYFKNITNDRYKELYENLKSNIVYIKEFYDEYFESIIKNNYYSPSEFLFLRNYSLIYNACNYANDNLDLWYSKIIDKNKERVVLVNNNISLEHYIKNDSDYLISWDNYIFDTPIMDLYKFYKNDWDKVDFSTLLDSYNKEFKLLEEEIILFNVIISIPPKISFLKEQIDDTVSIRKMIDYLNSSSKLINVLTP